MLMCLALSYLVPVKPSWAQRERMREGQLLLLLLPQENKEEDEDEEDDCRKPTHATTFLNDRFKKYPQMSTFQMRFNTKRVGSDLHGCAFLFRSVRLVLENIAKRWGYGVDIDRI